MTRIVLPAEPLEAGPTALRPWRDTDVAWLVGACQDPDIPRWTAVPSPYRELDARTFLSRRYDALHAGSEASFAIVRSTAVDHGLLGSISLLRLAWDDRRGEVGYWLAREARGQGHTTRAVLRICCWGFKVLGLERIELLSATGNLPSQRVAERAGFTREAVLRSYLAGKQGGSTWWFSGCCPKSYGLPERFDELEVVVDEVELFFDEVEVERLGGAVETGEPPREVIRQPFEVSMRLTERTAAV